MFLTQEKTAPRIFADILEAEAWAQSELKKLNLCAREVAQLCNCLCTTSETWKSSTMLICLEAGLTRLFNIRENELAKKKGLTKYNAKVSVLADFVMEWDTE